MALHSFVFSLMAFFRNVPLPHSITRKRVQSAIVIGLLHSVAGIFGPAVLINDEFVLVMPRFRCFDFRKPEARASFERVSRRDPNH